VRPIIGWSCELGRRRGLAVHSPYTLANQIFGLYYWCVMSWLGGPMPGPPQLGTLMRMSLKLLLEGVEKKKR
jgi:hypothetical protein